MDIKRVFLIILDSVGMGPAPDAEAFGDHNPNTLGHIAAATPGFSLPVMESLGLGNIEGMTGIIRQTTVNNGVTSLEFGLDHRSPL